MKNIYFIAFFFLLLLPANSPSAAAPSTTDFHNNLAENRREEISIVDEHTVKVGLGPDQRSVSCTILDAVGSIPSINGKTEPRVVFVNKEKVNYISPGLYTWDRAGKYRVRLTTKYIREFGEIIIRVPSKLELETTKEINGTSTLPTSIYYEALPEIKKQEITIIDSFMVEVGLGPDLKSIRSDIQDAIKSIPSVTDDTWPEHVIVNGELVFFIGNGLYSWDSEGMNPVKITTPFVKKFGNVKVSISGKPSPEPDEPAIEKPQPKTPEPETASGKATTPKEKVVSVPAPPKITKQDKPITKTNGPGLKGFRLATFGMDISQVKKVIQVDFEIEESQIKASENLLTIFTNKLSGDDAKVQYLFSPANKKLARINILWDPSGNTESFALRLVQQFLSLRFLDDQTSTESKPYLYYGKDPHGNEIQLKWIENPGASHSKRPLMLSYLGLTP